MAAGKDSPAPAPLHQRIHPLRLFEAAKAEGRPLFVAAPMVRYSKLAFRRLVTAYGVDITYTPMMLAHEFIRHPVARDSDFSTQVHGEGPVIAQFASSDATEFARAAEMIAPWVDGVDLNCGCPQTWAIHEGIGCSLMRDPERIAGIVREAKRRLGKGKSVSVKIRIHKDLSETKALIDIVTAADVDWITIHGRTRSQRSSTPPDLAAIKELKAYAKVPIVANGDVYDLAGAHRLADETGADGVMSARGLLENPALFAGFDKTPMEAVTRFLVYAAESGLRLELVLHHLSDMMGNMTTRKERSRLVQCTDLLEVIDWLDSRLQSQSQSACNTGPAKETIAE